MARQAESSSLIAAFSSSESGLYWSEATTSSRIAKYASRLGDERNAKSFSCIIRTLPLGTGVFVDDRYARANTMPLKFTAREVPLNSKKRFGHSYRRLWIGSAGNCCCRQRAGMAGARERIKEVGK